MTKYEAVYIYVCVFICLCASNTQAERRSASAIRKTLKAFIFLFQSCVSGSWLVILWGQSLHYVVTKSHKEVLKQISGSRGVLYDCGGVHRDKWVWICEN